MPASKGGSVYPNVNVEAIVLWCWLDVCVKGRMIAKLLNVIAIRIKCSVFRGFVIIVFLGKIAIRGTCASMIRFLEGARKESKSNSLRFQELGLEHMLIIKSKKALWYPFIVAKLLINKWGISDKQLKKTNHSIILLVLRAQSMRGSWETKLDL